MTSIKKIILVNYLYEPPNKEKMGNMKGKNTQIRINTVKIEIFSSALDEFIHEIDTNSTD